jgi:hypothetical protein
VCLSASAFQDDDLEEFDNARKEDWFGRLLFSFSFLLFLTLVCSNKGETTSYQWASNTKIRFLIVQKHTHTKHKAQSSSLRTN